MTQEADEDLHEEWESQVLHWVPQQCLAVVISSVWTLETVVDSGALALVPHQLVVVHQVVLVVMWVHVQSVPVRSACNRHHRHQPGCGAVLVLQVVQVGVDVVVAHQGHHHVHQKSHRPHPSFHLHQHHLTAVG